MPHRRRRRAAPEAPPSDPIPLTLETVAFGGESLGHLADGRVIFVPRTLPGEEALVRVVEERKDFSRGELAAVLVPAPERMEPPCPYFSAGCGGCSWQHADYEAQLRFKQDVVCQQLRRIGHFEEPEQYVRPTLGMVEPWHYRNQARFTVGHRFGELCFTFRSTRRLMRVDHCWITHPTINRVLEQLQERLAGVERRVHQISIRVGANTGQMLVAPDLPEVPEVQSGQRYLEEELLGTRFRLQANSFFQVNTRREQRSVPDGLRVPAGVRLPEDGLSMAEVLALLVLDRVAPTGRELVVDAYGGVGTFALLLAPYVEAVVGIEEARAAVEDAEHNGRGVPNARFVLGRTEDVLPELALERRPDVVILDPARPGAHPAVLEALLGERLRPPKLVYVSCDPSTLARDLRVLVDGGYRLQDVQPVDMFPQTYHVECVATLAR